MKLDKKTVVIIFLLIVAFYMLKAPRFSGYSKCRNGEKNICNRRTHECHRVAC
jgi:hypothetical protein